MISRGPTEEAKNKAAIDTDIAVNPFREILPKFDIKQDIIHVVMLSQRLNDLLNRF